MAEPTNEKAGDPSGRIEAMYAFRMELQSEIAKTREFAIERSDKARNGALGVLSTVFAVIGLLSYQNLLSTVRGSAEKQIELTTTKKIEETSTLLGDKLLEQAVVEFKTIQGDQLRPAAGTTKQVKDSWQPTIDWGGGHDQHRAFIHVDISKVEFTDVPIVLVTSVTPSEHESKASIDIQSLEAMGGALSVGNVTTDGFDVFLYLKDAIEADGTSKKGPAARANFYGWYFNWIAIGKTRTELQGRK